MTTRNPTWVAEDYRLYNDTGAAGSSAIANQNTAGNVQYNRKFRLRVAVGETFNANTANVGSWVLRYNVDGGAFSTVTGTTSVRWATSAASEFVNGNTLTQALGGVTGSANYQSTWSQQLEGTATTSSQTWTDDDTEYEFCLELSGIAAGSAITFRVLSPSSSTEITFTNVPTVNVIVATYPFTGSGTQTAAGTATTAVKKRYAYSGSGTATAAGAATTAKATQASPRTYSAPFTALSSMGLPAMPPGPFTGRPSTKAYSASGGSTTAGAATTAWKKTFAFSGSGTATAAGAATTAVKKSYAYAGSGGAIAAGAATTATAAVHAYAASGGATAAGSATTAWTRWFAYSGSGTATAAGAATAVYTPAGGQTYAYTGDGGATAGGTATTAFSTTYVYAGSGGATAGGTATTATAAAHPYLGSGGAATGGTAEVAKLKAFLASGGATAAGAATTALIDANAAVYPYEGDGGATAAGEAFARFLAGALEGATGGWAQWFRHEQAALRRRAKRQQDEDDEDEDDDDLADRLEAHLIEARKLEPVTPAQRVLAFMVDRAPTEVPDKVRVAVQRAKRARTEAAYQLALKRIRELEEEEFAVVMTLLLD